MPLHNVCSPFLHHCLFACLPVSLDQASATAKSGTGNKLSIQDCGDAEILMYKQANRAGGHCCKLLLLLFISTLSLLNNKNFLKQNGNLEEGWLDGCTNDLEMKRLSTNDLTVCIFLSFPLVKSNSDTHTHTFALAKHLVRTLILRSLVVCGDRRGRKEKIKNKSKSKTAAATDKNFWSSSG